MKAEEMLAGGKYKVTWRLETHRVNREMLAVFIACNKDDRRRAGPVEYIFSGRPVFGTTTLSENHIKAVEYVPGPDVKCYASKRTAR